MAFNFSRLWAAVEQAREKSGLTEAQAAKKCGFSRATWYNYRNGKYSPTLEDLQGIARALGFAFRSPLVKAGMSDPDRSVGAEQSTGGLHLSTIAQQIVVILATVPEEHHGFILDSVKNAAAIKGFQSPGADTGAAAARRDK